MKITEIAGFVVKIGGEPYLGGHGTEAATMVRRGDYVKHQFYNLAYSLKTESFLVRITTEDGTVGWGEAQAPLVPEVASELVQRLVGPFLLGKDVFDTAVHWSDSYNAMRDRGHLNGYQLDAIAACDIALWDLKGKLLGRSVSSLIGGRFHDPVPCYVSGLPVHDDAEAGEIAKGWLDKGFKDFKVALGRSVDADTRTFAAIREAVGDDSEIYVDAHWRYTVSEAIALGKKLEPMNLGFLEAPIAAEDANGQAEIARSLTAPVAIGEELRTRYDFRERLEKRSADILQPDVGRMGVSETVAVASLAEAFNAQVALHLGVGLGVYIAAGIQVASALSNLLTIEYQPRQFAIGCTLLQEPLQCVEGAYLIPDGPGNGILVNEDVVNQYVTSQFTINAKDI